MLLEGEADVGVMVRRCGTWLWVGSLGSAKGLVTLLRRAVFGKLHGWELDVDETW